MNVGTINWNLKVCISLRASSGKKIDSHRCVPNTWVSLEELLTFTSHNSPEPKKRKCSMHLSTRSRGLVWVYCEQKLMPRHTSRKATHIQYIQYAIHEINYPMQTDTNNNMDATAHVLMWSSTRNLMRMPCRRTAMPSLLYARVVQKRNKL